MKTKFWGLTLALAGFINPSTYASGLLNGGFESPSIGHILINVSTPPLGFGWTVASGNFDIIGSYWQAASGNQSVDLNGGTQSSLYQDFTFPSMGNWAIRFNMSANPDSTGNPPSAGITKSLSVNFGLTGGSVSSLGSFTLSSAGRTYADMQWVEYTTATVFISSPGSYRVQFSSLTPGASGPALDNVSLVQVPEPSIAAMVIVAMAIIAFGFGYPRMRKQNN